MFVIRFTLSFILSLYFLHFNSLLYQFFENYELIDSAEKEISLITIKLPSFCFSSSRIIKSDKGFDPYSAGMYITMDDAYDERLSSVTTVEKQVTISILDDQYQILDDRSLAFNYCFIPVSLLIFNNNNSSNIKQNHNN